MTSNSRMGEFFSVSVGERGAVALGWSGAEDLYWWEYEMTSTLGSDIRKNINQARAIYSLLKFRNGLQRHMGICVTGVYADMLITQNLGSILPPGTTSSPWPSLSLPYCSLLVYKSVLGLITVVFFSFFLFFFFFFFEAYIFLKLCQVTIASKFNIYTT